MSLIAFCPLPSDFCLLVLAIAQEIGDRLGEWCVSVAIEEGRVYSSYQLGALMLSVKPAPTWETVNNPPLTLRVQWGLERKP